MNRKLTQADRDAIHRMLGSRTHAELAELFHVSTRTIDREAAWYDAHVVTVRARAVDGMPMPTIVTVGDAVGPFDMGELLAEVGRVVSELEGMEFPVDDAELARVLEGCIDAVPTDDTTTG